MSRVTVVTDKVMRLIKAMVFLAMRLAHRGGATAQELVDYLAIWSPGGRDSFHEGIVERVLIELQTEGRVSRDGNRWHLIGVPL